MGVAFLTVLSLLSNTNLQERQTQKNLSSSIEIGDLLTFDTTEQIAIRSPINVTAKKNDSLYTILKKIKVKIRKKLMKKSQIKIN